MSNDANDFLLGGGGKSAKFENIGDTVTGRIVSTEVRQQTDIKTGEPLTWENGDPRMQLVVTLATDQRDDEDDDGHRAVYVKGSKAGGSQSMHDAVRTAVQTARAKGLEAGGTLTVSYVGAEPAKQRGMSDRKLWQASYTAPDLAATSGAYLGTAAPSVGGQPAAAPQPVSAPATQPTSAPAPVPPAAAPAGGDTPLVKAKALHALGMSAEQIAPQLGLDTTVVAALIAA